MGLLTLKQFRDNVEGNLDRSDGRLSDWVNFGYLMVTGAVEFDEMVGLRALSFSGSVAEVPEGIRVVQSVIGPDGNIGWIPNIDFFRSLGTDTVKWTRIGKEIRLTHKEPGEYSVLAKLEPTPLVADGDRTDLPSTWDLAIVMAATAHALAILGEIEKATYWEQRSHMYVQSRADEEMRKLVEPGLGASMRIVAPQAAVAARE
jgi:hypothetical protein